jgi:hypothetical protein
MKKHIPGLIFFTLIISLFAVAFAVARLYRMPEIGVVEHPVNEDKNIWFRETPYDKARIRIVQAIADPAEKTVLLDLSIDEFEKRKKDGPVGVEAVFSFYVVEGNGARHVSSERISIVPAIGPAGTADGYFRLQVAWVDALRRADNLYVVARTISSDLESSQATPFSRDFAAPVLMERK